MRRCFVRMLPILLLLAPASAYGQVAWDGPLLLPPRPSPGLGIYLTDMEAGGIGVLGTWRPSEWNYGVRFGIAEGEGDADLAVFGGVDFLGVINTANVDFPVDVDWLIGVGAGIGNGVRLSAPLGLTFGYTFQAENARFIPYLTPRVHLDAFFDSPRDDDLSLGAALDLGIDVRLYGVGGPFSGTTIRFGASMGDRDALGIGIVF